MKLPSRDAETSFRNTRQSSYYILNELRRVPLLLYITPSGIKKKIPSFQGTAKNRDDEIRREMSRAPCLYGGDLGDPSEDRTNDREGSNRARHAHHANWPGEPASAKNRAAVRAATLDSCASGPEPDGIPLSFSKPLLPPPLPRPHTLFCPRKMCPGRPLFPIPRPISRNAGFSDRPLLHKWRLPICYRATVPIVPLKACSERVPYIRESWSRNW